MGFDRDVYSRALRDVAGLTEGQKAAMLQPDK